MELNDYQRKAMSTRLDSCNNDTYMFFGLVSEVGELCEKIAKWRRKRFASIDGNMVVLDTFDTVEVEQHRAELMKELGDVLWFVAGLANRMDFSLEEVAQMNIDKLSQRKQDGTIVTHTDH